VVPPMSDPPPSARAAALEALHQAYRGEGFLRDALHAVFRVMPLEPRDRALATQLAMGTVRHRRTLRLLLSHLRRGSGRERDIQPELREILELGAFQLLFLDRVPAYAAVNEAAEQARQVGGGKTAGFVNGMLRGLKRLIAGRDPEGHPARDALPHPDGGVVRLKAAVLPDPQESVASFLGAAYSYPDWLVARWLGSFGDKAEAICRWQNRRPHILARVNASKAPPPADLPAGPRPGTVDVSGLAPAALETLLAAGTLTVQDPSAMEPVLALAPVPGETVLDLCASPGTKTTQIAESLAGKGRVVACDRTEEKLRPIREAMAVRGVTGVTTCLATDVAATVPEGGFDAALVDAPCSNTGVLARRVEARWRLRPEDLQELPRVQLELVSRAAALVRPGGRLVYSTCSIQEEENGCVVAEFLNGHPEWRRTRSELVLPGSDHDGVFWALFVKGATVRSPRHFQALSCRLIPQSKGAGPLTGQPLAK